MRINSDFDGGSIRVLDASDPSWVTLSLRPDSASDFRQWFFFRVEGAEGTASAFAIVDAGQASFPDGFADGYRAAASYDGETWFRVPTEREGDALVIRHTPSQPLVTYACFAPYDTDRHLALVARAEASPRVDAVTLGQSVEGRPLRALIFGDQMRPLRRVWIIAHQHPGETMAAYCVEGVILRLLDDGDPLVGALLDKAVIYVVPRMNPDGCAHGNHRTNAAGRDLNREWESPSREASPEVLAVREVLDDGGIDLFLDIHGEEAIPYVFDFGAEGIPSYDERLANLEDRFREAMSLASSDYQREEGYERDEPGEADMRIATNWVAERFGCLSMGIEMPFKDNENDPDPELGWSPDRSRRVGGALIEAILGVIDEVR
jgi:murein tripeptide amidase MpaA